MWAFPFNSPLNGMRTKPTLKPRLHLDTSTETLERASKIRAMDVSPEAPITADPTAMIKSPMYKKGAELIRMVMLMKYMMVPEIRFMGPNDPIANEFCRLCCNPYSDHDHVRWHLACCGAPCGRPCLAIALYHDESHACPFCQFVFPNAPWNEEPDMPTYSLDDKDFAIFCNWYETESTFAMTKVEFPVGDSGGAYILNYPRKRYGCWARTTFAPVRPVEAQTKESFSVLDLEVEGQALVCKVNLGS